MPRWNGNGLAEGIEITTGNVNAGGNGDTVAYSTSGSTGSMVTEGDGVEITAPSTGDIERLDIAAAQGFTSSKGVVAQAFFTFGAGPATANERLIAFRNSSLNASALLFTTGGDFRMEASGGGLTDSDSPALVDGHRYRLDACAVIAASPTTSNGRCFFRLMDLTDPTWNSTGDYFWDSTADRNLGTTNIVAIRFGKQGNGTYPSPFKMENIGWDYVTVNPAHTSRSQAEAYFMEGPGVDYVINVNDNLTLSDIDSPQQIDFGVTHGDSLALTDAIIASKGVTKALADTLGLADSVSTTFSVIKLSSDTLALSDTAAAVLGLNQLPADTLTLSDSIVVELTKDIVVNDQLSLSDTISFNLVTDGSATPSDTLTITDSILVTMSVVRNVADTLTLTDDVSFGRVYSRVVGDTLTLSDQMVSSLGYVALINDSLELTDIMNLIRPGENVWFYQDVAMQAYLVSGSDLILLKTLKGGS